MLSREHVKKQLVARLRELRVSNEVWNRLEEDSKREFLFCGGVLVVRDRADGFYCAVAYAKGFDINSLLPQGGGQA